MKVIKKYALTEESLEKDLDKFIRDAKKGEFRIIQVISRCLRGFSGEGLKVNLIDELKRMHFKYQ